ncbi:MAG: hypothetical protein M0042_15420, partial [Nitrospiraceae bacterium]|nr:hypothetical protein [Nitrospiraceae bacterium]
MRVTLKEIADKKGITWHAVRKRKLKEGWVSCGSRLVNHKIAEEFETSSLPVDINNLFSDKGVVDATDGGASPPSGLSVASTIDQERLFAQPLSGHLAPAQLGPASGHSLKLLPGPDIHIARLSSGEIVRKDTGEILSAAPSVRPASEEEIESELYAAAPEWARRQADKYLQIIRAASCLKGAALRQFIIEWNSSHPDVKTSYDSILEARKKYSEQGIIGLLAKYGHSANSSSVQDAHFDYFKAAYLKEGAPSVKSCWTRTLGFARLCDPQLGISGFPSSAAFLRRLNREMPKSSIYLARFGPESWNRKFASHVDRDYSQIKAGEVFVSDHAQVDVAVMLSNGRVCFPWITAWRDFKTSKWLGWIHHPEPPNSDFIFQSFYYTVREHGLPSDVYIG